MKTILIFLFFLPLVVSAYPWGHRYATEQTSQNITVDINTSFTVSVEWGEGDWTSSSFGYGLSTDGTGWTWSDLPWFQDNGVNKRCKTTVSISNPGKYYYAYRFVKSGTTSYSFGSDAWSENSVTLSAVSTIIVGEFSIADWDWSSTSTWNSGSVPGSTKNVGIYNAVTLDQPGDVKSLTINSGGTLSCGINTLNIATGGNLTNNGTFDAGTGTTAFAGTGTVSGTIGFYNVTLAGGVNFGSGSSITGSLTVNNGGFVSTNAPVYSTGSTLIYNSGTIYGRNLEWSATSSKGYPYHVQILGGTTLDLSANGYADRALAGNLLLGGTGSTGSLSMGATDKKLTIGGNIVIGGTTGTSTLTLSSAVGGDIEINGDWTRNSYGAFTTSDRAVFFVGSAPSVISTNNLALFNYVFINKTGGASVTIDNDVQINNNLTINNNAAFIVKAGTALTVTGTLTNSAGVTGLVIKSDVTNGTGSLKNSTAGVSATVERYIASANWNSANDGWHFLSSPIKGHPISPAFTVATAEDYDFYAWYEPNNIWVNYKYQSGTPPTWFTANNNSLNFQKGKGYMVAYKTGSTKSFTGVLNVGDTSYNNLSISGGANNSWHLLGNPYSSAITWDAELAWNKTAIGGVANIWDEAGPSYHAINAGDVIPAGNGFMVYVSNATNAITIPDAKRTHSTQAWYKSTSFPIVTMLAKNLDEPSYQECQVRFNPEATTGFDLEYDGKYLSGYAPQFYSVANDDNLMVNSLPELTSQTSVPFSFIKNDGTNFEIEVSLSDDFPNYVFLKDKKTGSDQNITVNPVYSFTASQGDDPARFLLHFGGLVSMGEKPGASPVRIAASGNVITIINPETNNLNGHVTIYNLLGQVLKTQQLLETPVTKITMNGATGYYLVKVITGNQTYTGKVFLN